VLLKELGKLKKSNDLIGNRTGDFPACRIVPQPTMLPIDPSNRAIAEETNAVGMTDLLNVFRIPVIVALL
jgi:hypothetical protein